MKKSIIATLSAVAAGGLVVGGAAIAFAHTPQLTADCHGITVSLTNYPNGSTVHGVVDGTDYGTQPFGGERGNYSGHVDLDGTVSHTYTIDVVSGDGQYQFNKHYANTIAACDVVTPPVTTPPVETPPATTPPVETPPATPPVTTPPTDEPTQPPVTTAPPVVTPPATEPPTTKPPVSKPPVKVTPAPTKHAAPTVPATKTAPALPRVSG